jgi:hypothetical protein
MTNITALLLVLAMTGAPAASVVCVAECQPEPATSGHCHGDMAASDRPMMSASDSCNDPSISDSPFVIQHRALPGAAVLTTTSSPTTLELVRTDAPAVLAGAVDAWLKPPLVLRL